MTNNTKDCWEIFAFIKEKNKPSIKANFDRYGVDCLAGALPDSYVAFLAASVYPFIVIFG